MTAILFHVQHLLGIGHLQRALCIAEALVERAIDVTLVSGGMPVALAAHPAIRRVQLEPVRALDARFALVDAGGQPVDDELRNRRTAALLEVFAAMRPGVVVIEGFPFARRAFRFELDPLIEAARRAPWGPRIVCSLRDIVVVRDDPARHREIVERARRDFDSVLVHGDPSLVPLDASFPAAPAIADLVTYTGYVAPPPAPPALAGSAPAGEIVVSAGGGAAGAALLTTALAARLDGCLAHLPWRILTGGNLPDAEFAKLRAAAPAGVAIERFRGDFRELLRGCRVSVSQAGYNTVLDLLAARARCVLVPFAAGRETEQPLRAGRLAALGAAELVREDELTPASLASAIERAAMRPAPTLAVDMGGARRAAAAIAAMISERPPAIERFVPGKSACMLNP